MKKSNKILTIFLFLAPIFIFAGTGWATDKFTSCQQTVTYLDQAASHVPLFFLTGVLKQAAAKRHVSVLTYLKQEIDRLAETKLATHLLMGPFQQQIVLDRETARGPGDSMSYYYLAQFRKKNHIMVDNTLGTEEEFRTLVHSARSKGLQIMVDFVAAQTGYPGASAAEQAHYVQFLFQQGVQLPPTEFMERSVAEVLRQNYPVQNRHQSLSELFLETHVYLPPFGWRSRVDPEIFYPRGDIDGHVYDTFSSAASGSEELRQATEIIQTKELSGLPKLYLDNPALQEYIFAGLEELAQAGVTGFRVDAARHMKFNILLALIKRMIHEVKKAGFSLRPEIYLEYWTTNLLRVKEAMDLLKAELGEDFQHVFYFDHQFPDNFRRSIVNGESLGEIAHYLSQRSELGIDVRHLLPVVIDHDGYISLWNGSVDSVVKTIAGYALSFFSFNRPGLIYNAFTDLQYSVRMPNGDFPRYQMEQFVNDQSSVFQATNALYQYLGKYATLFENSTPEVYRGDFDSLVIARKFQNQRLVLRISRGEARFHRPPEDWGTKTWDYYSEHFDGRGLAVEIFHQENL